MGLSELPAVTAANDLCYLSATEVLRLFRTRELSPVEFMTAVVRRAEDVEPQINAFSFSFFDEALEAAEVAADRYVRAPDDARPLEGLPLAVKELTPVAGQPHTLASLLLADVVATQSDPVVERLQEAGAIFHARTTTPEFGCASFTQSRLFGVTRNPWNLEFSPAGSSGGAAAALAAGITPLAQGSDSAGSLRLPAAACGVVGLKPSRGRVPVQPPMNLESCSHNGPMARSARDCGLLYDVMAGPHPRDFTTQVPPDRSASERPSLDGARVAVVPVPQGLDVDPDVDDNFEEALGVLADNGATVERFHVEWPYDKVLLVTKLLFGATYGPRVRRALKAAPDKLTPYALSFAEEVAELTKDYDFLLRGHELLADIESAVSAAFERYDLLALPTLALPAPVAGEQYLRHAPIVRGREQPDRWIIGTTVPFNLMSACPAISVPSGVSREGIPTGMQIVGRPFRDDTVLGAARVYEADQDRYVAGPRPQLS